MSSPAKGNMNLTYIIILILIGVFAFVSVVYARYQNIFMLNKIIITGNHELQEEEIIYITGLELGSDLLKIPVLHIIERLEKEPFIRQAHVYKRLPDCLIINIRERIPILIINMNETYAVDNMGILLPGPRNSRDLPVLTGIPSIITTDFGKTVSQPQIRQGAGIISLIRKKYPEISIMITELNWSEESSGWIIKTGSSGGIIYLGQNDLKQRIHTLDAFIKQWKLNRDKLRNYTYIDLRYDKQVIVKSGR